MAEAPTVSYDRILRLAFVASVGIFIFVLMWAMFENAHSRGLPEPFQYVFYAAGVTVYLFLLPRLLKGGE